MIELLAVDPGLNRTGYAAFESDAKLVDMGFIRPKKRAAELLIRVEELRELVWRLCSELNPRRAVIEIPSRSVGHGRHGGGGHGAAIYGMAAGAVYSKVCDWFAMAWREPSQLITGVQPETWTRGRSKVQRARYAALLYPDQRVKILADYDVSDAVGIGVWWFGQQQAARLRGG